MTFSSDPSLNTNQLPISLDINPQEESYQDVLQLYIRRIANVVNTKESGLHLLQETANFEQWFNLSPQQNRNGYRTTIDFVRFKGSAIGATYTATLTATTQPPIINGYLYPIQGYGGAIDANGISYFLNDPLVYVNYNAALNALTITNNTGVNLSWAIYVIEYLKN